MGQTEKFSQHLHVGVKTIPAKIFTQSRQQTSDAHMLWREIVSCRDSGSCATTFEKRKRQMQKRCNCACARAEKYAGSKNPTPRSMYLVVIVTGTMFSPPSRKRDTKVHLELILMYLFFIQSRWNGLSGESSRSYLICTFVEQDALGEVVVILSLCTFNECFCLGSPRLRCLKLRQDRKLLGQGKCLTSGTCREWVHWL